MAVFGTFVSLFALKNEALIGWFNSENFSHVATAAYDRTDVQQLERRYHEQHMIHPDDIGASIAYIDALILNDSLIRAENLIGELYPTTEGTLQPTLDLYHGIIFARNNKSATSIESFKRASTSNDEDIRIRALINLAHAFLKNGNVDEAEKQISSLQQFDAVIPEITVLKIELSQYQGFYSDTKKFVDELRPLIGNNSSSITTSHFRLFSIRFMRNVEGKSNYVNEDTNLARKNFTLGNAYMNLGMWEKAMDAFEQSAQHANTPAQSLYWLGVDALVNQDYERAQNRLEAAISQKGNNRKAKIALGTIPN